MDYFSIAGVTFSGVQLLGEFKKRTNSAIAVEVVDTLYVQVETREVFRNPAAEEDPLLVARSLGDFKESLRSLMVIANRKSELGKELMTLLKRTTEFLSFIGTDGKYVVPRDNPLYQAGNPGSVSWSSFSEQLSLYRSAVIAVCMRISYGENWESVICPAPSLSQPDS